MVEMYENYEKLMGYDVYDSDGNKIGGVKSLWHDRETGKLELIGTEAGWMGGRTYPIPAENAVVDDDNQSIRVPYREDFVKDAPNVDPDEDLSDRAEMRINEYYMGEAGVVPPARAEAGEIREGELAEGFEGREEVEIPLAEEELRVGKREVEAGGMRLRKVVETEHVEQPVELRREEVEIEREPATGEEVPADAFQEKEYYVPASREEAVAEKDARIREVVEAHKETDVERRDVEADLRREDVEVEREGEFERR